MTSQQAQLGMNLTIRLLLVCTLMGLEELAFNLFVAAAVVLTGFLGMFLMTRL
jgi:hypothetical protein